MKKSRGFTLIEILVVLVIIAVLVSMAAINTDQDPQKELLHSQAQQLKFSLEAISDEAIFYNKQIGLYFLKTELAPFSIEPTVNPSNPQTLYEWQPYEGRFSKKMKLVNDIEFNLLIDGNPVPLAFSNTSKENIVPQIQFQSSGEQTLATISLKIADYEPFYEVYGNGIGRFYIRFNDAQ